MTKTPGIAVQADADRALTAQQIIRNDEKTSGDMSARHGGNVKASASRIAVALVAVALLAGSASTVEAVPFTITATLTGDIRPENPDNLLVNVTITGDTTSNTTSWVVDINSPLHPDADLGAFFFNLAVDPTLLSFSSFSPSAWAIQIDENNAAGSGGARFQFEANDPPRSGNNVTNSQTLTFTAQLAAGNWTAAMFLDAPLSDGDATTDPGVQLGAHLRSLSIAGCATCTTDGGFAGGNYSGTPTTSIPEPGSMMLIGLGLAGFVATRRRKH